MKVKHVLFTVIVLAFSLSFYKGPSNELEGTWELVSGEYISPNDTLVVPQSPSAKAIKVINKTHFATVHQDPSRKEIYCNAGTYTLDEDIYTENLLFVSDMGSIGMTISFTSKIEGDQWTVTGPLKESDEQGPGWELVEVWKKVK